MKVQAAVVKEQGIIFAVVVVQPHVLSSNGEAERVRAGCIPLFPGMPIVLMAQDPGGRPRYWGRRDIVNFLANVYMEALPWKEFTFSSAA